MKKNIGHLSTVRDNKAGQMELVKQEKFAGLDVDFYRNENNEVFMTRKQIGEALEYSDPRLAINKIHMRNKERLDKFSKQVYLFNENGKENLTTLYNTEGIKTIISISERPITIKQKVANIIDSEWSFHNYLKSRQEDEYIHLIQTTFMSFHSKREVKIDDYRCDLLFPDFKLVIECDEYGHQGYDEALEIKRENHIKSKGYDIIRFNPNDDDFYIGNVLGEILKIILEGKQ